MQEKILLAIYPGLSIEECLEIEEKNIGCLYGDRSSLREFCIIGLPCSLARVLYCLGDEYWYESRSIYYTGEYEQGDDNICCRRLLNDDGTDCNLFEQYEETQDAIALILGRKDE